MKSVTEHVVLGYTRNETQKEEKRKRFWVNTSSFGLTLNGKEKKLKEERKKTGICLFFYRTLVSPFGNVFREMNGCIGKSR